MWNKIKRFKLIVLFFRIISPGFGRCEKCGLPWNHCHEKAVYYSRHSGTFATCQYCWNNSSIDELKKYYSNVYSNQLHSNRRNIEMVSTMDHTRSELLDAVEREYNKEYIERRKQKLNSIKSRTKKNRFLNDTLFNQN